MTDKKAKESLSPPVAKAEPAPKPAKVVAKLVTVRMEPEAFAVAFAQAANTAGVQASAVKVGASNAVQCEDMPTPKFQELHAAAMKACG